MSLTAQQIENNRMGYAIMFGFPAHRIALCEWRDNKSLDEALDDKTFINSCKSVGCIAGVLSAHPYFRAQNLTFNARTGNVLWQGQEHDYAAAGEALFGLPIMFGGGSSGVVGKRQALERFVNHLHKHGAITYARHSELRKEIRRVRD